MPGSRHAGRLWLVQTCSSAVGFAPWPAAQVEAVKAARFSCALPAEPAKTALCLHRRGLPKTASGRPDSVSNKRVGLWRHIVAGQRGGRGPFAGRAGGARRRSLKTRKRWRPPALRFGVGPQTGSGPGVETEKARRADRSCPAPRPARFPVRNLRCFRLLAACAPAHGPISGSDPARMTVVPRFHLKPGQPGSIRFKFWAPQHHGKILFAGPAPGCTAREFGVDGHRGTPRAGNYPEAANRDSC